MSYAIPAAFVRIRVPHFPINAAVCQQVEPQVADVCSVHVDGEIDVALRPAGEDREREDQGYPIEKNTSAIERCRECFIVYFFGFGEEQCVALSSEDGKCR